MGGFSGESVHFQGKIYTIFFFNPFLHKVGLFVDCLGLMAL